MCVSEIANQIFKECMLKEADLINDIKRVLNLNLDDLVVSKGQKVLNLLDKFETSKESTLIEKQDLVDIKEKIRKAMELFQESMESLFAMHERLVQEKELI
jgi:hypothetical protein